MCRFRYQMEPAALTRPPHNFWQASTSTIQLSPRVFERRCLCCLRFALGFWGDVSRRWFEWVCVRKSRKKDRVVIGRGASCAVVVIGFAAKSPCCTRADQP